MTQAFTRATVPDLVALRAALPALIGATFTVVYPVLDQDGIVRLFLDKPTAWQPSEITAVQAACDATAILTPQLAAQRDVDSWPIELKALALALIDQLNVIRAALPVPLGAITPAQAIAAVRAKAGTL